MSERVLLIETAPFDYTTHLVEAAGGEKFLEVEGRFQHADLENHNGRIYPMQLWRKVMSDPAIIESLEEGSMLGELDHPTDGKSSLKNISHIVTGLRLNEGSGEVVGRARILNNEWGKQLRSIFEAGGKVGISSRGSGSVRPQGGVQVVQEDFKLNTFDFVVQPSTPNAFPKPKNESTFKSKDENATLQKEPKQEDRMDSIKRLTDLREAVAELRSEPIVNISKRAKKRLVQEAVTLEVEVTRLMQEDASVASVAGDLAADLKKFRTVVEGDKPDFFKKKDDDSDEKSDDDSDDSDKSDDDKDEKKEKKDKKEESVASALSDMEKEPTVEEKLAEAVAQRDAAIRQARTTYRIAESALQSTGMVMNALRAKVKALLAQSSGVDEAKKKPQYVAGPKCGDVYEGSGSKQKYTCEQDKGHSGPHQDRALQWRDYEGRNSKKEEDIDLQVQLDAVKEENSKLSERNQRLETIINKIQEKMLEAEKADDSGDSNESSASVEESATKVDTPTKKPSTDPLPKMGTVKQIIESQQENAKSHGASLASRALGVMTKVRTSHVQRGDSILESKSNVR